MFTIPNLYFICDLIKILTVIQVLGEPIDNPAHRGRVEEGHRGLHHSEDRQVVQRFRALHEADGHAYALRDGDRRLRMACQ